MWDFLNLIWLHAAETFFGKLTVFQLQKFPAFYGTKTSFTRAGHLPIIWARSIHSITSIPIPLNFYSLLVTWCTTSLTFNNCTLCPHCIYVFVFIWEQTTTCATYSINWLVFITEMKSVYSAVRTGSLNKAVCSSCLCVLYLSENKQRLAPLTA